MNNQINRKCDPILAICRACLFLRSVWCSRISCGSQLVISLTTIFLIDPITRLHAQCFEARGLLTIRYTDELKDRTNYWTNTVPFTCTFVEDMWRIAANVMTGAETIYSFDGHNVLSSQRQTMATAQETENKFKQTTGLALVPFSVAQTNLTIDIRASTNGVPVAWTEVNLLWMAYCSSKYFSLSERSVPLPGVYVTSERQYDLYGYKDQTQLFPEPLGLPKSVKLTLDRKLTEQSINRKDYTGDHAKTLKWLQTKRFNESGCQFEYLVTSATNVSGKSIPIGFIAKQRHLESLSYSAVNFEAEATATNVATVDAVGSVFNPAYRQTVVDHRFTHPTKNIDAITYFTTNNSVVDKNDPKLQLEFNTLVKKRPLRPIF